MKKPLTVVLKKSDSIPYYKRKNREVHLYVPKDTSDDQEILMRNNFISQIYFHKISNAHTYPYMFMIILYLLVIVALIDKHIILYSILYLITGIILSELYAYIYLRKKTYLKKNELFNLQNLS